MAKINPRYITRDTECYAAVEWEIGFRCGRVKGGKLYSLENPELYMIMPNSPEYILAAFETEEELMQWREDLYKEPEPDEVELERESNGRNRPQYDFSYLADLFSPQPRVKAMLWAEAQTKDMYGEELMAWAKARMKKMDVYALDEESTTAYYLDNDLDLVTDYGSFLEQCAVTCKLFYFGNGGEGIPNLISEGKGGSGKFVVSSIL